MKVSVNWLREWVAFADAAEVARRLTLAGFEVEGRSAFGKIEGVVVVEVRAKRPHPNAAKLMLVDVWDGAQVTQVVCGAPNVPEPGARVLWAKPGARLPSGVELGAKEVRGILSPGMLCAEDELGFSAAHQGLVVLGEADPFRPGDDLAKKLGLPDEIWELNVTPNRPDCLGHVGVAREIAGLTGARLEAAKVRLAEPELDGAGAHVQLVDREGCPRYTALILDHVKVGPSPLAVRLRLGSLGVRALSNVVDATNLVLLEASQPLHAFDLDRLAGHSVSVRRAREGEKITTLDGVERLLSAEDVAICDGERPVAVAGVMGGASAEVSAATTRVLLESAYFDPGRIRRTAKRLGLHTEASHRFERGVDPAGAADASRRAAQLIQDLAGGRVVGHLIDLYPAPIRPRTVELRPDRTRALLGAAIADREQLSLLGSLGLEARAHGGRLQVTVPTRRPDLTREVDLIEEVARLHGYDRLGQSLPRLLEAPAARPDRTAERARDALVGIGFDEIVTYAFVAPARLAALDARPPVRLANPIREELSVMRSTLLVGLLEAGGRNLKRGVGDLRLFEIAEVFLPRDGAALPDERPRAAGLLSGRREGWLKPGDPVDFFDAKGAAAELLSALGHSADFEPPAPSARLAWLHPGAQATVRVAGQPVGVVGELHPDTARAFGIEVEPFVFEIDLASLPEAPPPAMQPLPRFPSVDRDLSFFVADRVLAREITGAIAAGQDPLLVEHRVLEDYREGGKVPAGKKGMLWSFTFRAPDRTLTDAEVDERMEALRARLKKVLAIEPR